MTEFLRSIKSDLLSRHMLPLVGVVGVALLAAIGYALTGGSGGSTAVPSASLQSAPATGASAGGKVSVAPENPHIAVSETPGGARYQSQGPTRDPFTPLASPAEAKRNTTNSSSGSKSSESSSGSTGSSSGGSSTGSSSGGTGTAGGTTPVTPPAQPAKPSSPSYVVVAALANAPTSPTEPVVVTPYVGLKANQPLPSKQDVRLSFERVSADGKGAIFKLVVAPILHGPGTCLPSTSDCQSIDLAVGQVEELEYVEPNGQTVGYALRVVSINKVVVRASTARTKRSARTAAARQKAQAALAGPKARAARG
ncbi:MAG: hypothetical protein WBQ21_04940 [Solirubrobacteraceae bacterium]